MEANFSLQKPYHRVEAMTLVLGHEGGEASQWITVLTGRNSKELALSVSAAHIKQSLHNEKVVFDK